MKRTMTGVIAVVVLALGAIVLAEGLYTVTEMEQAVVTQFKKIVRVVPESGLHWKTPFVQKVHYLDKRLLEWDGKPTQIPTRGKKFISVDTWARWRIVDPEVFYTNVPGGTEEGGQGVLDVQIESTLYNEVSSLALEETVRSTGRELTYVTEEEVDVAPEVKEQIKVGRQKLLDTVQEAASSGLRENYGMELEDVRIKRINYVEDVRRDVYERMRSERKRIAAKFLSEARSEKNEILGDMNRQLETIESEGYREARIIRGRADAEAATIYAETYGQDPEFYQFLKSLETYQKTIDSETVLLLGTDEGYFRYLQGMNAAEKE